MTARASFDAALASSSARSGSNSCKRERASVNSEIAFLSARFRACGPGWSGEELREP
jgi:hypothetical protein